MYVSYTPFLTKCPRLEKLEIFQVDFPPDFSSRGEIHHLFFQVVVKSTTFFQVVVKSTTFFPARSAGKSFRGILVDFYKNQGKVVGKVVETPKYGK